MIMITSIFLFLLYFLDSAWIDPAAAAAAAVGHHPGLSTDPYHPDYGIGR